MRHKSNKKKQAELLWTVSLREEHFITISHSMLSGKLNIVTHTPPVKITSTSTHFLLLHK